MYALADSSISPDPASAESTDPFHFDKDLQTSILIADDHLLLSEAVSSVLSSSPRHFQTRITSTLDEVLNALASESHFDLVLLDLRMPGMEGLKSVERVIKAAKSGQVVLMSGYADRDFVEATIESGARGLIPKTLPLRSLASAIDFVLTGQVFMPLSGFGESWNSSAAKTSGISDRELSIVRLLSEGQTNKEMANAFGETEVNVKMHMRSICRKLDARNRAHVVSICNERGLI